MFRRQLSHSMESAHQFSSSPDCNNTADVPSFTLRTALSAIPFAYNLCGLHVQERTSQALPNSKKNVGVNDFRLPIRLQELLQAPLSFLRGFCFARIRLDPVGGQVLHYDCISMIVSRFEIVTEDLGI